MPLIEREYIDTGKVYFEYRDFPITSLHASAVLAAHAANCAGAQESYYPMHDRIFQGQEASEWGKDLSQDFAVFLGYARDLQLDQQALQSCVQSQQFKQLIASDYSAGIELGIQSTPTFLVNGELLVGAQPFGVWEKAIEAAIEKAAK